MNALVTGATGFVGSHLVDMLLENNFQVRCIYRKSSNLRWLEGKPIELIEANLYDVETLKIAVKDCDYVFHVGGLTFAKDYDEFLKGNKEATKNLLDAIKVSNPNLKRFVYLSSLTVGGPSLSLNNPIKETDELKPITSYGKSKKEGENVILNEPDIPYTIIRAPAIFGPRDTAIFDLFKTANFGLGTLIGFKPKYVSILYVTDICDAMLKSISTDKTINKAYFISSSRFYHWDELITGIKKALGKKFFIKFNIPHFLVLSIAYISEQIGKLKSKPPVFNYEKGIDFIQNYWICSNEAAEKDFGFVQKVDIFEAFELTVDWYKKNNWLK